MEDFDSTMEEYMTEDAISNEINCSYDRMYECFMLGNPVNIAKKIGSRSKIEDMISHFSFLEEYEKCHFLKQILEKL